MANLTPKQEKFCQCVASGMSYADSYKEAYDAENMGIDTIYVNSSVLMSDNKISLRVNELRKPAIKKLEITLEKLLNELEQAKAFCLTENKKDLNNYIKAIQEQGKLAGLYIDKQDITSGNEPITIITGIARDGDK